MFKKRLRWLRKAFRVILVLSGVIAVLVGSTLSASAAADIVCSPVNNSFSVSGGMYSGGSVVETSVSTSVSGNVFSVRMSPYKTMNMVDITALSSLYSFVLTDNLVYYLDFDMTIQGTSIWYFKQATVTVFPANASASNPGVSQDFDVKYVDDYYRIRGSIPFVKSELLDGKFGGFQVRFKSSTYLDSIVTVRIMPITIRMVDKDQAQTDEIVGAIEDQNKQEEDAANQQGQESIDDATSAIPNNSAGFIAGINSLASSMAYSGTEAKWDFPAIKMPAIPGVMDEIALSSKMEIDFGFWVQKIPSNILQVVQVVCTVALIVYCFKEVYSQISYALTQKGGGADA